MQRFGLMALVGAVLLAGAIRSLGFEWVILGAEGVAFPIGDASYHARLVTYAFENFPQLLAFDFYQNFPTGGAVPWPPLFDWSLAAAARLLSLDAPGLDRLLAWASPILGALTVIPVFLAARRLAGDTAGWLAALMLAVLPVSVSAGQVGNCDHHAAVALLAASLLACSLALLAQPDAGARTRPAAIGLFVARTLLVLTWNGSILYLGVADGALALVGVARGRTRVIGLQSLGLLASALVVAPFADSFGGRLGGPFSAIALSWLQVVTMAIGAIVLGVWWIWELRRPAGGAAARLLRAAFLGALSIGLPAALPGIREPLERGLRFVSMGDAAGSITAEQLPLLPWFGRRPFAPPQQMFGWFAYLLPLLPVALFGFGRRHRQHDAILALTLWTLVFGVLAIGQNRYANDLGPPAAIGIAILVVALLGRMRERMPHPRMLAAALGTAIIVAGMWPQIASVYLPQARAYWPPRSEERPVRARALATAEGSFLLFGRELRRLTPETAGFLNAGEVPEYSVLANPNIGDWVIQAARRPTPTTNFWDLYPENFEAAGAFFGAATEEAALAAAARVRARYAVAAATNGLVPGSMAHRLYALDGAAPGAPLAHCRLIAEGPIGGSPYTDLAGIPRPPNVIPYKLFELVAGAELVARDAPGTRLRAVLVLVTPAGRRIRYETETLVDAGGVGRLIVPYPTRTTLPIRALEAYRVTLGERALSVNVSEADVMEGRPIPVGG